MQKGIRSLYEPTEVGIDGKQVIYLESLKDNDIGAWLELTYQTDPQATLKVFNDKNIPVESKQDLFLIRDLYKRKGDENGEVKDSSGNPIIFNTLELLKGIDTNVKGFIKNMANGIIPIKIREATESEKLLLLKNKESKVVSSTKKLKAPIQTTNVKSPNLGKIFAHPKTL